MCSSRKKTHDLVGDMKRECLNMLNQQLSVNGYAAEGALLSDEGLIRSNVLPMPYDVVRCSPMR